MKKIFFRSFIFLVTLSVVEASCNNEKNKFDASGSFEAEETIISSEVTGVLKQFSVEEGQELKVGQIIGYVDSTQLFLKKKQLDAQIKAVLSGRPDAGKQLAVLQEQLKNAEHEQKRFTNLIQANAGTQKQLDDINAQIEVLKKQMEAQTSTLGITSGSITEQTSPLQIQIEQINDQLTKSCERNRAGKICRAK